MLCDCVLALKKLELLRYFVQLEALGIMHIGNWRSFVTLVGYHPTKAIRNEVRLEVWETKGNSSQRFADLSAYMATVMLTYTRDR